MSEDIVEWLRTDDNHMTWTRERMMEAADEIEKLRSMVDTLQERVDAMAEVQRRMAES